MKYPGKHLLNCLEVSHGLENDCLMHKLLGSDNGKTLVEGVHFVFYWQDIFHKEDYFYNL